MPKTRVATGATIKSKKGGMSKKDDSNILLARGLSARYCGANTPLSSLTPDEMERDLRHMEAFSHACVAYAQQYYIYQNSAAAGLHAGDDKAHSRKKHPQLASHAAPQPLIAMPVRIDPEEEKRLATLRLKIQHCEAQREVLESQYLSLRAHYVHLSQRLKNFRTTVNGRVEFLQDLLGKRAKLLALQRARLQISREVLACLNYRQTGGKMSDPNDNSNETELAETWNKIDEEFKKAEESCRIGGLEEWQALKVPKIPPGVPLLLSQLAKPLGFAAAWSAGGMFGSKEESLCWLEPEFPEPDHRIRELPALREEAKFLRAELGKERSRNQDLQKNIISRRRKNDELVAMMGLLRTETEAVVARHNILLTSDFAKNASLQLHDAKAARNQESSSTAGISTNGAGTIPVIPESSRATAVTQKPMDNANDGDDEGGVGDEEDEEGETNEAGEKRSSEAGSAGNSPRSKRRKL